jgi:hypothetical protein
MKIKPVSTWQQGQEVLATEFVLLLTYDNLKDSASFSYSLYKEEVASMSNSALVTGQLTMTNPDYDLWNDSPTINNDAYTWALSKLNLIAETI